MFNFISRIFRQIFSLLNHLRKILLNLFFFGFLFFILILATQDEETIIVKEQSALILNLQGDVVEQKTQVAPLDAFMQEILGDNKEIPEVLLSDIVKVINNAADDDRITLMVLKLNQLNNVSLTQMLDISAALDTFKAQGKKIIAASSSYTQAQYYLASFADEIWLDPKGWMMLDGYGRYQLYFKSALDKLKISQHVFRVGTYKSAVEPYLRDDMSEAAREANSLWLNDLWSQYKTTVAKQRNFSISNFDEKVEILYNKLKAANGSVAEYALSNGWIDALKTRNEIKIALTELVGKNENGKYNRIKFKDYLSTLTPQIPFESNKKDKVAIIVAKGTILDGKQKTGTIGGDSTAKLLRKARFDDNVKAVVLRVDSPGGSAFASEIIRREILLLKESGKPVVASMGTYAASGGYWISVSADKIIAAPTTITGSIGIFGLFMTFEQSLSEIGVHTDGVGTTELAGFGVTQPLSEGMSDLFQIAVERGYRDFISLVAENRNMSLTQVDEIAQGRVWSGATAKELGLVDELGNLDTAIEAAATLAGLENYGTRIIENELSSKDMFLKQFLAKSTQIIGIENDTIYSVNTNRLNQLLFSFKQEVNKVAQFNDPQGIYALCEPCSLQ